MMKIVCIHQIFIYVCYGILNKKVVQHFPKEMEPIILNKNQFAKIESITSERKELLFEVYKQFGGLADLKLREMVLDKDSPVGIIFSNPTLYYLHLTGKVGYEIPKFATKEWFKNNFMEY